MSANWHARALVQLLTMVAQEMAVKTLPFFNYTTRYRECPRTAAMGKSCGEPRAVELIEPLQTEHVSGSEDVIRHQMLYSIPSGTGILLPLKLSLRVSGQRFFSGFFLNSIYVLGFSLKILRIS